MAIGIFARLPDEILKMVEDFTWEDNKMDCECDICGRMNEQSICEACDIICSLFDNEDDDPEFRGLEFRWACREVKQTVQDFTGVMTQLKVKYYTENILFNEDGTVSV